MIKTLALLITFLFSFANAELEEQKINYLLDEVEKSGLTFSRNNETHSAKEARAHLKFKYHSAKGFFFSSSSITARNFIDKIASSSSTTGELYYIISKDGKKIPTKEWLDEKLKKFAPPKKK
ncbi:DUF5329 family protein [Halobacteriovorax sp. HLS]|uniref:DUF5329 family protein n=1 Tax=Halobacteriovorax sp. HLS TaxID=2234000 RepID=UPI000FDA7526|nr:DUF5329 family protein [Halobacteriovorax sp. HLS]